MKKRLFPIFITLLMMFAMMLQAAGFVYADGELYTFEGLNYVIDHGDAKFIYIDDENGKAINRSTGTLTIHRAVMGTPVTKIGVRSITSLPSGINKVIIPKGVRKIESEAFYGCHGLTSVSLPLSLEEIWVRAFDGCDALTTVHYGGSREQWEAIQGSGKPSIDLVKFAFPSEKPNVIIKGTRIKTLKGSKKALTVKWKKQTARVNGSHITGYQIQLATNKKFTKNKRSVTVKGYKKVSKKVTRLKCKKKYYVRIRTYKTISGKKYYSRWSKTKSKKTR